MLSLFCIGQSKDSTRILNDDSAPTKVRYASTYTKTTIKPTSFILPASFILYGAFAIHNGELQKLNHSVQEKIYLNNPHGKTSADDYLPYMPAATVFGLNALGISGKHNFRDLSILYLTSNIILNAVVVPIKKTTHQLRPDSSAYSSFPSGHTAEAFASAEFMRLEYRDISPWYGILGYGMAICTGYLRMYNNKHWLSDVVAGAGIGIASTKIAYLIYNKIQPKLFKGKITHTVFMPSYRNGQWGFALTKRFN